MTFFIGVLVGSGLLYFVMQPAPRSELKGIPRQTLISMVLPSDETLQSWLSDSFADAKKNLILKAGKSPEYPQCVSDPLFWVKFKNEKAPDLQSLIKAVAVQRARDLQDVSDEELRTYAIFTTADPVGKKVKDALSRSIDGVNKRAAEATAKYETLVRQFSHSPESNCR